MARSKDYTKTPDKKAFSPQARLDEYDVPEDSAGGRFAWLLFGVSSVLALILRLAYLIPLRGQPLFDVPLRDSLIYVERAREILAGDFLGAGIFFHSAPLYPYFLALLMGPGGEAGLWWVRVAQALLSAMTAGFLALCALRLFGRGAGIAAAILAIAYAPFLFYSGELLEITLSLFFLSIMAWLAGERDLSPRRLALIGLFLGLAALGKPNLLLLAPVFLIYIGWLRPLRSPGAWPWRRGILLLLGIAVAILPFTLRNRIVGGDWVLISSNAGINFFIGNNPMASGGFWVPSSMQTDLELSSLHFAEQARGRELKPSEASRFWGERAWSFYKKQPGTAFQKNLRKTGLLLGSYEIPNHYNIYFFRDYFSALLRAPLIWFPMVLPLALLGLIFGIRRRGPVRLAGYCLLVAGASVVLFFVTSRYRLPMLVWLIPFAGAGLMILLRLLLARRWRLLPLPMLVIGLSFVLLYLPLVKVKDYHEDWITLANHYATQEDWLNVTKYNQQALRENLDSAVAWQNLGFAYTQLSRDDDDLDRAEQCLWKAAVLDPTLGHAFGNLASFYFNVDRIPLAKKCLDRALALDPGLQERLSSLGRFMGPRLKSWDAQAVDVMARVESNLEEDPHNLDYQVDKAHVLALRLERYDEALLVLDGMPPELMQQFETYAKRVNRLRQRIATAQKFTPILDQALPRSARFNQGIRQGVPRS